MGECSPPIIMNFTIINAPTRAINGVLIRDAVSLNTVVTWCLFIFKKGIDTKTTKKKGINAGTYSVLYAHAVSVPKIDLRNKVTAENNQSLIIESVESIDNKCSFNENDIEGLTFKVTTTDSENVCRFKYNVKPASSQYKGTSEAIVQVVVTKDYTRGDFLPPISRTVIEGGLLTLNSKDLLIN